MYLYTFPFLILPLTIPITHGFVSNNKPVIGVTQGVIEKDNVLPISVFWYHPNITKGDRLLVYFSNSRMFYMENITIDSYTGSYEVPHGVLERGETSGQYCAVIITEEGTLDDNPSCESKIQWMYDRRDILRSFALTDLFIPGSHQSAAYAKSELESLNDQSLISRWLLCQTKSIKSQLMDGIRYLDLRPGILYIDGKRKYILTHAIFNLIDMNEAVRQINEFMNMSKDIVIVSLREFSKGFYSQDDHENFIHYLEYSFELHAHPRRLWMNSLNSFWSSDKRLLISYDHKAYSISSFMWPSIRQYWADVQTIGQLHSYLDTIHRSLQSYYVPYAAMAELTHSPITIAQDVFDGEMSLRHWAERLSKDIRRWYIEEWNSTANIVVVDFYQTSGIVDIAIQLNEKRAELPHYPYD